jgi:nicotinamidase-related amidase
MATTLLLIDLQRNMLEPPDPVPGASDLIATVTDLLERARAAGVSVIHVRNNGTEDEDDFPGTPGWELYHTPIEGEAIVDKFAVDAFEGTELARLIPPGSSVVTAGLVSDFCVRATVRSGVRQGYAMHLVRGAHRAYDRPDRPGESVEKEIEQELRQAGAELVEPRSRLF